MLVPENSAQPPPETEDKTSTPGAATSGLRRSEIVVGPTDEKSACVAPVAADLDGSDRDRRLGVRRRRHRAGAEVVVVVSGCDHGHDARCGRRVQGERDDVAARLDLRLPAREVDDVHPVGDGRLDRCHDRRRVGVRAEPGVGLDEDLVVAEVCARRDARDASLAGRRVCVAGRDPGDVRPVARVVLAERELRARGEFAPLFGANDACDDHLRRREPVLALGEAGRHRVAGRVEERVLGVDARVDDPDLDSLSRGVERLRPRAPVRRSAAGVEASRGCVGRGRAGRRARREAPGAAGTSGLGSETEKPFATSR